MPFSIYARSNHLLKFEKVGFKTKFCSNFVALHFLRLVTFSNVDNWPTGLEIHKIALKIFCPSVIHPKILP